MEVQKGNRFPRETLSCADSQEASRCGYNLSVNLAELPPILWKAFQCDVSYNLWFKRQLRSQDFIFFFFSFCGSFATPAIKDSSVFRIPGVPIRMVINVISAMETTDPRPPKVQTREFKSVC